MQTLDLQENAGRYRRHARLGVAWRMAPSTQGPGRAGAWLVLFRPSPVGAGGLGC